MELSGTLLSLLLVATVSIDEVHPSRMTTTDYSRRLTIGLVLPKGTFVTRSYSRTVSETIKELNSSNNPFEFMRRYSDIRWNMVTMAQVPSPNAILNCLCTDFLSGDIPTVIVYVTNTAMFAKDTAASQYFLQLTDFLGIPVIAWNAANSGLDQTKRDSVILQMAPSIQHQAAAMLDVLREFEYHVFAVVTSHISGHIRFVQAIRERILVLRREYPFHMVDHVTLDPSDEEDTDSRLKRLKQKDTRIMLLYSTENEANDVFARARLMGLTGRDYLWVVTQSVVRVVPNTYVMREFPIGLIGVYFDTSDVGVLKTLSSAIKIVGHGLEAFHDDPANAHDITVPKPNYSCTDDGHQHWRHGARLHRYLKMANFTVWGTSWDDPDRFVEFKEDGTLKDVILDVVNLQKEIGWQRVGMWLEGRLFMRSIMWPSGVHTPPLGVPEKYHLRVTFLEEPPFLLLGKPDETTGYCRDTEVKCRIPPAKDGVDPTGVAGNETFWLCCSGFSVDLLRMLANDLKFTIEMTRVADGLWGSEQRDGTWNGLIADIMEDRADMAMTALKINSEREKVVSFTVPFMDTGIAIIVAKRTGIISPHAFLEPFDMATWILIMVVCVHAAAVSIFIFEWLSPSGYDRQLETPPGSENLSLFRSIWLVWAMIVKAAVDVVHPRGLTARFVANVWALFALVYTAIYTANLAAFMITREEYHNLEGIEDDRLMFASVQLNPLRFGTIPHGNTDSILSMNFPPMRRYMKKFSRPTVAEGVAAVKSNALDAFIYDATVLDYLVGEDDECRLLTVGEWYAKTGYAIAFPRNSVNLVTFNDKLLLYRADGVLDRLKDYWLTGVCKPKASLTTFTYSSLSLDQFISVFILLGCGILLGAVFLAFEKCYHAHLRNRLVKGGAAGVRRNCILRLISQNLARSLTLKEAVEQVNVKAGDEKHKCGNPRCELQLWKVNREKEVFRHKAEALEQEVQRMLAINNEQPYDDSKPFIAESSPPNSNGTMRPDFMNDVFHINQWNV